MLSGFVLLLITLAVLAVFVVAHADEWYKNDREREAQEDWR
jgi:hypothetical protein